MTTQAWAAVYLLVGFIFGSIVTAFHRLPKDKTDEKAMVTGMYLTVLFWPLFLPLFMVAGILTIRKDT